VVAGEYFLLRQAFANLLENALDFTPKLGVIHISAALQKGTLIFTIENEGEAIPEFAFARLTERFYSLPRPATGKKSTGLGLNFVHEVALLHQGNLQLRNTASGVAATIIFRLH
jgi:two-component system sensor histidine kinase CreC